MLITKEMDYAIRCLRALYRHPQLTAKEIAKEENMPTAVTYKMLNALSEANLVNSTRGAKGGYYLNCDPAKKSALDVFHEMGLSLYLKQCVDPDYRCENNKDNTCLAHDEFVRIQGVLERELSSKPLADIF